MGKHHMLVRLTINVVCVNVYCPEICTPKHPGVQQKVFTVLIEGI